MTHPRYAPCLGALQNPRRREGRSAGQADEALEAGYSGCL